MNQPGMDIRINGSLSATRFDGAIRGKFPADGEWHTLQIPTEFDLVKKGTEPGLIRTDFSMFSVTMDSRGFH